MQGRRKGSATGAPAQGPALMMLSSEKKIITETIIDVLALAGTWNIVL